MKRTKRNNTRLKGGSNRSSNNSTKKNDKCIIEFYDSKITWRDDKGKSLVRGRSPPYSTDGLPRPGFQHKRAPRSIKNNKKQHTQEQHGSLKDNTDTNQSNEYYLSYDKNPIPRCKKTHQSAYTIENNKLNRDIYFIKKPKKSKGGKKSSYKSRKTNKK
tara:strand:+ start:325 stop:801 length:477 start_codon:yes stop_codon:yes gene_type:complete